MADFQYKQNIATTARDIIRTITDHLTTLALPECAWTLSYPANNSLTTDKAIIQTTTTVGQPQTFYLKFERDPLKFNCLTVQYSKDFAGDDLSGDFLSAPARYAWYREDPNLITYDWLGVEIAMSFSKNFINLVLQGAPSLDYAPYNNYLISYMYAGQLESFEGGYADDLYNFGLTAGSDIFPAPADLPITYGRRTATAITDIDMLGTRTGTPYQAHLIKFNTSWEWSDRNFISSSAWTRKYPASPMTVWHAYDRDRGKLQNVLILDRAAIFHLDTLFEHRGEPEQKEYVMFNINAPYSIINNSPNVLFGIALRKS
ncbi:MAG: hypothetical protein LBU36_02350 [Clostridiales bacterium]|jgi:hypothetical protein|nr:hypothetical protein [Clostridiales bacterium]